jgi:hypothetical protein
MVVLFRLMKKATFVMVAVLAAAVFIAIGTATPIFETAFAQDNNQEVNSGCNGAASNARCQVGQRNVEGDNDVSGDINLG